MGDTIWIFDLVKFLIPIFGFEILSDALRCAAEYGYTNIAKLLIPVSNPKVNNSIALRFAAESGYIEIVKLLIPVSDPKAKDNYALRRAAEYGHTEIVKLLIPVSDPKLYGNKSLRCAIYNRCIEIAKLLTPLSEIDNDLINYCKKYCINQELLDLIIAYKKENK